ncbi:hypothetical protein C8J56DRAFT_51505 [Mycena floridula]|nr:hypothetical protein C8J56DRAFT_51505 [Mycena floridula]
MQVSQDNTARVCKVCSTTFRHPSNLKAHMAIHTGETPFKCPYPSCGRSFNVKSNMTRHYSKHSRDLQSRWDLSSSRPEATQKRKGAHPCHICWKPFRDPSTLKVHLNAHTGENSFECRYPNCGKAFNVKSNLARHYRKRHLKECRMEDLDSGTR